MGNERDESEIGQVIINWQVAANIDKLIEAVAESLVTLGALQGIVEQLSKTQRKLADNQQKIVDHLGSNQS